MTDFTTQQQLLAPISSPKRIRDFPRALMERLFRSRRPSQIDFRYANEHFLKDIGLDRCRDARPMPSMERIW